MIGTSIKTNASGTTLTIATEERTISFPFETEDSAKEYLIKMIQGKTGPQRGGFRFATEMVGESFTFEPLFSLNVPATT